MRNFLGNGIVWLLLVNVCLIDGATQRRRRQEDKNGYIFTCPRSLKTGNENELQLQRFGNREAGVLKVQLFYTENYNGNETLAVEKEYEVNAEDRTSTFKLDVPRFDNYVYNGRLQMNGSFGDYKIGGSDKVYFSNVKNSIVLIQTDKPLYQSGQDVKFRVLKLNKELRPSGSDDDLAEISVQDPKGTKLYQFNDVDVGKGISQREFSLSNEPVYGTWKISVKINNSTDDGTFDVKEYTLPKFDVKITFPPFVLANAEEFPVQVCAKYTYGKPVIGHLNLNVSLESYSWSYEKNPVLQQSVDLDGCFNYTVNVSSIEPENQYRYRRIMVVANVIEEGTGVQRNETQYLQRQYSPLNLNFNADQRQYFKPGLPYNGKLKVSNPDDSPASNEQIQLCATIERQRVISQWWATRKIQICKNYTSDATGTIPYTIVPQNIDSVSIYLEAKSTKYARKPNEPDSRDNILNQPQTSFSLSPYYSPSGSFIQLAPVEKSLPCGKKKEVQVLFTSKTNADLKFYYKIIKQGEVVKKGSIQDSFDTDNDISSELESGNQVLRGKEIQLVPPAQKQSEGDSSSAADDDCPAAIESKYTPPIGKIKIPIDVDPSLSPNFQLLVYYVRDDRETVADSQKIEVEKCFKNKVEFKFADRMKQPGTNTKISVKAAPNSLCGLKIVDKSISLLDNRDQVTKEKVFQLLQDMDGGNYYSSNPCSEAVPQPGLYRSSIILPPRPPSPSSSYSDSLSAFQEAGYLVMSDLTLFTRPCANRGGGGYGIYQTEYGGYGGPGAPVALASVARRPAAPMAVADTAKLGAIAPTKSAVEVRDYFPETWLFDMEMTGPDGVYDSKEKLPHTITQWDGSAVCVSNNEGLGISNVDSIQGFQAFFLSTTLPTSVVRSEEFWAVISIFSYADASLPITVTLDKLVGFEVTSDSINGDICIEPGTSKSLKVKLKGAAVGKQNITIRAETSSNADVCGGEQVSTQVARDAITNGIEVKAEGFPDEDVSSELFCPDDADDKLYSKSFSLSTPDNIVPDSDRAIVDVTGNVLGPAIQNIGSLVALPTGCGEQNMVKFTPNIFVLDYLQDIGQLTDAIKSKAIKNLVAGYQRELNYKRSDGSFSAFGNVDRQGSMFLTSFVLRSFFQAKKYILIDDNLLAEAQNFIVSKQQEDGCFLNIGQIIDHGLQGGLEKEKASGSITAYVLASLMIAGYDNATVINSALSCLRESPPTTAYQIFLYAYAEALVGDNEGAQQRIKSAEEYLNKTGGVEFYKNPNGVKSTNLETAAYAVLTILKTGGNAQDTLPLIRFMTQSLNPNGGFYSTQDTVVGLEALGEFAKLVYKNPVQLQVTMSGGLDKTLEINEENKMLIQRNVVKKIPGELNVKASGTGCGLIQTAVRYNRKSPPITQQFYLEVTASCLEDKCRNVQINVHAIYLPEGKKSGMSLIEIKMLSGFVPVKESLEKLMKSKAQLMRFDVENNGVTLYFPEITNSEKTFSFTLERIIDVENLQPAAAKVYDYYVPENMAMTSYLPLSGQQAPAANVSEKSEPASVTDEPFSESPEVFA